MKKSISQRLKITGSGKIIRRAMGQGHSRARKRAVQLQRRKKSRGLIEGIKIIQKNLWLELNAVWFPAEKEAEF